MRRQKEREFDPRYPLQGFRVIESLVSIEDIWTMTTDASYGRCNCGDHPIPRDCLSFTIDSGPLGGEVHCQRGTPCMRNTAIKIPERGSFFARKPGEKARPRRKRDNPPPPMSDLLGDIPQP